MAKPSMKIVYTDPNAKAVCRVIYAGPEGKIPYQVVVEELGVDGEGAERWAPARSHMPYEVVAFHILAAAARGECKSTVTGGVVTYDAKSVKFHDS